MNVPGPLPAAVLEILPILCCPSTHQPLRLATADELARLGVAGLDCALVREDGTVAYPVSDGIPVLIPESALPLK